MISFDALRKRLSETRGRRATATPKRRVGEVLRRLAHAGTLGRRSFTTLHQNLRAGKKAANDKTPPRQKARTFTEWDTFVT